MDDSTHVLETERLILRRLTMDDLDALAKIYGDPEVRPYFPEGALTHEETKEELEWFIDVYYGRYGFGLWATVLKETGELIGRCGLIPWKITAGRDGVSGLDGADEYPGDPSTFEVELAYLLAKEYWGRGLATEAARAIVEYAFNSLGFTRLICLIDPENLASRAVALKVGMQPDGDVELYGEIMPIHSMTRP